MIVLPLASEKGISTFEVGFQAEDKRAEILQADKIQLPASDIAIGRDHLSQMLSLESYKDKPEELTKWIRKNAAYNPRARVIYVTTGNYEILIFMTFINYHYLQKSQIFWLIFFMAS